MGAEHRDQSAAASTSIETLLKPRAGLHRQPPRRSIAELARITGGAVTAIAQVARLLAWVQEQGCQLQKLDRKAIEKQLLDEELPAPVRRALELRRDGAQAATKKIDALLARAGDGRSYPRCIPLSRSCYRPVERRGFPGPEPEAPDR